MSTTAETAQPFGLARVIPRARALAEWQSTRNVARWPAAPTADGQPVMLIPGFLAGDASLTRMALWLRSGGYELARSGIVRNTGCLQRTTTAVVHRLEDAVERSGQPAILIGQSRGGCIGRVVAVQRPDLVQTLVTLGSPMLDQLAVSRGVWLSIGAVGLLGTLGIPGMFNLECLRGQCCSQAREALIAEFPDAVRFLSIYSRSDEVVRWQACLDPAAEQLEVDTSHIGMAMARSVWTTLAAELAA